MIKITQAKASDQVREVSEVKNLRRKEVSSKEKILTGVISPRLIRKMVLVLMMVP